MSSIDLDGVSYAAGRNLLEDITVSFPAGGVSCLSGPSGAGKTTLLSVAGGLLPPTTGTATYAGRPTWQGTGDPRPEVTFVLQVYGLVPVLSALENVSVALRARGVAPAESDQRAAQALDRFHVLDLAERQVEELWVVNGNGWRWPGPWPRRPRSCWPTSRPASSTKAMPCM